MQHVEPMEKQEWVGEGLKIALGLLFAALSSVCAYLAAAWKKPSRTDVEKLMEPLNARISKLEIHSEKAATKDDLKRVEEALIMRIDLEIRPMANNVAEMRSDLRAFMQRAEQ